MLSLGCAAPPNGVLGLLRHSASPTMVPSLNVAARALIPFTAGEDSNGRPKGASKKLEDSSREGQHVSAEHDRQALPCNLIVLTGNCLKLTGLGSICAHVRDPVDPSGLRARGR